MRVPPQPPCAFDATPESLARDTRELIDRTRKVWDGIAAAIEPETATFANTLVPIIQNDNESAPSVRLIRLYASTSPSKELRDASQNATTSLNNAEVDLFSRPDIFALVDAVAKNPLGHLAEESRHYLEKLHRKFIDNGCGIMDLSLRTHFKTSLKRLKDVERQCRKTLHDESTGLWLTLEELEGVPDSLLSRLEKGEREREGMLWASTKTPQSKPILENARREATRRKVLYAVENRMAANVPLFRELVLLRDETARALGYSNHAAFRTAGKMVRSPEAVTRLLAGIKHRLVPRSAEIAEELLQLKQQDDPKWVENPDKVFLWDQLYYSRLQKEKKGPPREKLSEYFELHSTLARLLHMVEHIFGMHLERIDFEQQRELGGGKSLIWHEDVLMYSVWDCDTDRFVGYAYFDFYPRDGKYAHAGHYGLQQTYIRTDGTRFHPSSALVMNYNRPTDKPTLLTLDNVRSLFHEIGHLVHHLSGEVRYAASHSVDRDFVEAPSLMLEQFFWKAQHIKEVSCHYSHISPRLREMWRASLPEGSRETVDEAPLQLPDDVVSTMAKVDHAQNVRGQLKELYFATYDMIVHSPASHEALEKTNLAELFNKNRAEITGLHDGEAIGDGWGWSSRHAAFRAVMGSYDAGYYAYILGRVLALDIFKSGFEENTMSKKAGRRYRNMVLRAGGSPPEMKTVTDYLGRPPSTKPYFEEYLGVSTGSDEHSLGLWLS